MNWAWKWQMTIFMLAKTMKIDMKKAIKMKMEKIRNRQNSL